MTTTGRVGLALVAGALWASSVPPLDLGVAPAILLFPLVLAALDGATPRQAVAVGFAFAGLGLCLGCSWLYNVFGPVGFLLVPIVALHQVLFALGARLVLQRVECWRYAEAAVLWTGIEFFRSEWAPLANATMTVGATVPTGLLLNPARHIGVYGMTLLASTFGCLLYRIYCYRRDGKNPWRAVTVPALPVVVVVLWGHLAAPATAPHGAPVRLLAVQGERVPVERLLEVATGALQKASEPIAAVVLPEWAVQGTFVEDDAAVRSVLQDFVRRHGVHLVFGNKRKAPGGGFFNTAFVMAPDGSWSGAAQKSRPVPFLGDGEPTPVPDLVRTPFAVLGLPICYDADFATVVAGHVARGAQLLILPTRDNRQWGWFQHLQRVRLLRLRAVETGRWAVRVNSSGPSVVVRPDGTFGDAIWTDEVVAAEFEAYPCDVVTPFVAGGWLLGPVCMVVGLVCVVAAWRRGAVLAYSSERST